MTGTLAFNIILTTISVSALLIVLINFSGWLKRIERKIGELQSLHEYCDANNRNILGIYINLLNLYRDKYISEERYEDVQEIDSLIKQYKKRLKEMN